MTLSILWCRLYWIRPMWWTSSYGSNWPQKCLMQSITWYKAGSPILFTDVTGNNSLDLSQHQRSSWMKMETWWLARVKDAQSSSHHRSTSPRISAILYTRPNCSSLWGQRDGLCLEWLLSVRGRKLKELISSVNTNRVTYIKSEEPIQELPPSSILELSSAEKVP